MEGGIIRLGRNRVPPVLEREAPHHTADRFHTALWSNMQWRAGSVPSRMFTGRASQSFVFFFWIEFVFVNVVKNLGAQPMSMRVQVTNKQVLDRRNYQGDDIREDAFIIFMVLEYGVFWLGKHAFCDVQQIRQWEMEVGCREPRRNCLALTFLAGTWISKLFTYPLQVFHLSTPCSSCSLCSSDSHCRIQAFLSVVCYSIHWRLSRQSMRNTLCIQT